MTKILIVDDDAALAQIFQQTLQQAGYDIILASSGKEAEDKALLEKPDIILLDQVLPDMNGNQVLQFLRQNDATKTTPVAIISNFNQDKLVDEAMKLGVSEYILKYQISPADLVAKVKTMITNKQGSGWQDTGDTA